MARSGSDDSGAVVYPPLPVPKAGVRESDPRIRKSSGNISGGSRKHLIGGLVLVVVGVVLGFIARPHVAPDARIDDLAQQLDAQTKATQSSRAHADDLQSDLDKAAAARAAADTRVRDADAAKAELADRAADADKKARALDTVADTLRAAVDKSAATVMTEGDEVHVLIADKLLFKGADDQLTDKGKAVLDKLAVALRELPDKQIGVQGHTDEQPAAPPPPPSPVPTKKPAKPVAIAAPPPARVQTSWELSAARALQVVHYLQDVAKLEPTRLAALAFGQYRPARANKALNRRIEIVLSPRPAPAPAK